MSLRSISECFEHSSWHSVTDGLLNHLLLSTYFQSLNNRIQGLAKSIQKGSARAEQCVHALPHELAGIWVVSLASKFQLLGKLIMSKFWQFFGPLFVLNSFVISEKLLLRRQEIRPTNLKIENTNEHGEGFLKGFH